jgi:hypothetical protein
MKPDLATLRTKTEQAISGLATAKGYLDDQESATEAELKQTRKIFRGQVESVVENLNDLTDAVENNEEL